MPRTGIRLKGDWPKLKRMMNASGFSKRLKAEQVRFLRVVGQAVRSLMVNKITSEKPFASNSPLTVILKGSSTPLVDEGDFVGSINFRVKGNKEVFVGVLRGTDAYNLAEILHDGRTIKVTKKMRGFFYGLSKANSKVRPLRASTKVIRIPPRPFAKETFEDERVGPFVKDNAGRMLKSAIIGSQLPLRPAI